MSYCLLCENIFNTTSALKNHKNRLQGNSQKKSLWTWDGHADAAMSDSCRLMRICGHGGCVSAEKSDDLISIPRPSRQIILNLDFDVR